jgi:RNA polymerase sigma factor (sigma-70 family)
MPEGEFNHRGTKKMALGRTGPVGQQLCRALLGADATGLSDRQLLEVYLASRDQAAFEALVRRHGALVWGVCRRVTGDHHDAEDSFQATFLVLARKAASLTRRDRLAGWLHGVAYQTARKARALSARRQAREKQVHPMPEPPAAEQALDDLLPLLDAELDALPEKYRLALVLCALGGKTQKEAAAELGVPQGTLSARLTRARVLLARRLKRRGAALTALPAALWVQHPATASVPPAVVTATVKAAPLGVAGAVSGKITALAEGVVKAMLLTQLKRMALLVAALVIVAGVGAAALGTGTTAQPEGTVVGPAPLSQPAAAPGPKDRTGPKAGFASPVRLGSANWRFGAQVSALAYANEGKWLVVADGPSVRVLDARTGNEVRRFKGQRYHINSLALAGDKVVVTGGDTVSHLWDVKRVRKLLTFRTHKNGSQNIRISPDGKFAAATGDDVGRREAIYVSADYSVRVWDLNTGKQLAPFAAGLRPGVVGVFSPDSKRLAWASTNGGVHLCSLANGKELFHYKGAGGDLALSVDLAFSPDGRTLAVAQARGVILLETRTGRERVVCLRKVRPAGLVNYHVAFSPRGDTVATCSEDGSVVFWDTATGKERGRSRVTVEGPAGAVSSMISAIAFAPDGKTLAAAPQDQTVRLLDVATKKQKNGLTGHRPVRSVVITPDGKTVITGHDGGKLCWWEAATGKQLHTEEQPPCDVLLALTRDGSKLYAAAGNQFLVWDVARREPLPGPLKPFPEAPASMALSPEGNLLAAGSLRGTILLWDLKTGRSSRLEGHRGELVSLAFTPDGKRLLSGSGAILPARSPSATVHENQVKLWDVQTGKEIRVVGKVPYRPESLAVSPDGKLAVSNVIYSDHTGMPLWDLTAGKEARRLAPIDGSPWQVAFAPSGKWLAVARGQFFPDTGGYVVLFDTATWKQAKTLRGHVQRITALAFSADSRYLVTGSQDSSALVWDLAELGK